MVKWGEVELPGFDAPLVAVTQERRDALAANVRELIADVKKLRRVAKEPEPLPPDEAAKVATACGLCRGYCCSTGGNEAYLNPRTIKRVWSEQAHLTADELVSAYLGWVPERAFERLVHFSRRTRMQSDPFDAIERVPRIRVHAVAPWPGPQIARSLPARSRAKTA